ncbi:MAG: lactate utilization protein [Desulfobacterales bacterium]|jgi:L-lactate dehydrogenase complex protein LldG
MSKESRDRIFSRLHAALNQATDPNTHPPEMPIKAVDQKEKIAKLKTLMEAMRTEVFTTPAQNWTMVLEDILKNRKIRNLLYSPQTEIGRALELKMKNSTQGLPQLIPYDDNIEQLKEMVFNVDAGITSAAGAIAETGALILWPTQEEPRLMSIVPSIHIAILQADTIHNSLSEVIHNENWSQKMPTNIVLISGPSKTADIEMTLAFGVHGPRELIVLIVEN